MKKAAITKLLSPARPLAPATFALVGASSTGIDVSIFWILVELAHVPPLFANAVSYSAAAFNSFFLNKFVTFRDRNTCRDAGEQLALFILVRGICLAIGSIVLAIALDFMPSLAAKLVSIVLTFGYPAKPRDVEARSADEWSQRANRKPFDEVVREV